MFSPIVRWCLLLFVPALTLSTGSSQPPNEVKPPPTKWTRDDYTAFPDLKPPQKEVKGPDGQPRIVPDERGAIELPPISELGANAPALRKVRYEQLHAGLSYLARVRASLEIAGPDANTFQQELIMATEIYRIGAELEEKPAKRVPWYEARVHAFKQLEGYIELRVRAAALKPKEYDLARFQRLQAEAELLMLKAEVEKPAK